MHPIQHGPTILLFSLGFSVHGWGFLLGEGSCLESGPFKKKKKEDDKLLTAVSLRLQFNLVCYAQLSFFSSSPTVTNAQFSVSSILVAAFFINSSNPSSVSWLQEGYSPFPTPPEFHTLSNKLLSKTIYFTTFFSPMPSTGYRSFWSTSKQCWQGHNWTFFSAQHQHYLEGLLSFSALLFLASGYNILPFSMGATLLACQVLPHSCFCLHSPKLFLEDHLLTAPQTNPFQVAAPTHSQQKALPPSPMQ